MAGNITLDTSEFDRAMVQYAAASNKDFADIANKRVFDVSLRSMKYITNASKEAINALKGEKDLLWWFAWKIFIPKGMSRSEAYEAAKALITKRNRAVGFLKGFFRKMATLISPFVKFEGGRTGMTDRGGKGNFAGFTPIVRPASAGRPTAEVGIAYDYKTRSELTANRTEAILLKALQGGYASTAADMMVYVDRKMGKTAKQYSARAA